MPVWLSDQDYATLRAACGQMMPSGTGGPGADEAGVADYIDSLLGAFAFGPHAFGAGGRPRGATGGPAGFVDFVPLYARLDESWPGACCASPRDHQGVPEA